MSSAPSCFVQKFDHLEVATLDLKKLKGLFETLGFRTTQVREDARGLSHLMEQGHARMVITQGAEGSFQHGYAQKHGDGVCRIAYTVKDADFAAKESVRRGGTLVEALKEHVGAFKLKSASIGSVGDVLATFVEREEKASTGAFWPGFREIPADTRMKEVGLKSIDHLTNNVEMGQMNKWADFYANVFGFEQIRYFDIRGEQTGLHSRAMQSPNGAVKIPINQATEEKSQVQEFVNDHKGAGVQHIALTTTDIVATVRELRARGIPFLKVPDTYYEAVPGRVPNVREKMADVQEMNILVDGSDKGYLLQIFTENQIGPLFFEIIQRRGDQGFGEGNFRALFEAMERDQIRRGVLKKA